MFRNSIFCLFLLSFMNVNVSASTPVADGEFVSTWNTMALESIRQKKLPPPLAVQYLAILHLSMFEAANHFTGRYASKLGTPVNTTPEHQALQRLKVAAAARHVLQRFAPETILVKADQLLKEEDAGIAVDAQAKAETASAAMQLVDMIFAAYLSEDGTIAPAPNPPAGPGKWEPTPPNYAAYLLPGWGQVQTFLLNSTMTVRPSGPPALDSQDYADAWDEVRRLGSLQSEERNASQTEAAFFWADGAGTATPPGHWNMILASLLSRCRNDLTDITRIYAVLNMAVADACIATWDTKWHFYFWRPITAIRSVESDWEPLLVTPAFPSYVSGHATISGTAAEVLRVFFGDQAPLGITSESLPGIVRNYPDFPSMAYDAARSRVYAGIHFNFDGVDGLEMGQRIAALYNSTALPLRQSLFGDSRDGRVCL